MSFDFPGNAMIDFRIRPSIIMWRKNSFAFMICKFMYDLLSGFEEKKIWANGHLSNLPRSFMTPHEVVIFRFQGLRLEKMLEGY